MIAAFFGAALAIVVVNKFSNQAPRFEHVYFYDVWALLSGAVGASLGLFLGRRWMGRPGVKGACCAMVGALAITFTAALIGGSLALPIYGTMFGPLAVVSTFYEVPIAALLWLSMIYLCHRAFSHYRQERLTLYTAPLKSKSSEIRAEGLY